MKILISLLILSFGSTLFANEEWKTPENWVEIDDMIVPASSVISDDIETLDFNTLGIKPKKARLWPDGILPLQFAPSITKSQRQLFLRSCDQLGEYADIQCVTRQRQDRDYLSIVTTKKNTCGSSYVGRKGGKQKLTIKCWRKRTIQHELMHALGMAHEQNRMDRDEHIHILWENMKTSSRWNYQKVSLGRTSHYLSYYDFDSIMHYSSFSGSKAGNIVFYRRDRGPEKGKIRQSNEMSYGDHFFLYALYGGEKPRR